MDGASPGKLFSDRLEAEGKIDVFHARIKEIMAGGLNYNQAKWQAMREFGYEGMDVERSKHLTLEDDKADRLEKKFQKAFNALPPTANLADEMEWVRAHPAMNRRNRMKDQTKLVVITASDIEKTKRGPAPSQAAVNMLVDAANRPAKFWDKVYDQCKKTAASGGGEQDGERADTTIGDLRSYMQQLKDRVDGQTGEATGD